MARQICAASKIFEKLVRQPNSSFSLSILKCEDLLLAKPNIIATCQTRNTNFFNKLPAQDLWKGITSVSSAGKKRGRAKTVSKKNIKDLNRGQVIGVGKANMIWPGLTTSIIRGRELVEQQKLPEDPEHDKKLAELRDKMGGFRHAKLSPIERGWSGFKMPGRSLGAPDPIGEEKFDGFDTRVLEFKLVFNMKGNFGRKRRMSALVVTGNGKGLGGFASAKALEPRVALRKAKNRSGQKLIHIKLFQNHTVCHHFFTQFGATKIYVWQKPEGYGLRCHRAIKTICDVVGIKNLYAKVEGSTNVNHVMKAFFLGLIRQKSPEEIAEDKKLHLVEICQDFPNVLASPKECRKAEDIKKGEVTDFEQYCFDGKVVLKKKKHPPFYTKLYSHLKYLNSVEKARNLDKVRNELIKEYGEIRTFLTDKHPECKPFRLPPKEAEENSENA